MGVGRPKSFDAASALQHALHIFWSNGFEATSMQDLLGCTGLSRSSLYEEFGSKRALFERCIEVYREGAVTAMTAQLASSPDGLAFIRAMLQSVVGEAGPHGYPRGCLVMNTAVEFSQKDPQMARLVARSIAEFTKVFRKAVKQAQAEGQIPAHKNATELARFIVANMSGLRTLAKAGAGAASLRTTAGLVVDALRA